MMDFFFASRRDIELLELARAQAMGAQNKKEGTPPSFS